jgi:hypothetical protein
MTTSFDVTLEPSVWRLQTAAPQADLVKPEVRERFWRAQSSERARQLDRRWLSPEVASLVAPIMERTGKQVCMVHTMREGHPEDEYDHVLISKMEAVTPQFNLRNVMRMVLEVESEWVEWGKHVLPDRAGYTADLKMVREARVEPPAFVEEEYSSRAVEESLELHDKVFRINDWEKWYGEDKKRAAGAMWAFVPEDGGVRTRPWKKVEIVEHKFWKGRLITQDY